MRKMRGRAIFTLSIVITLLTVSLFLQDGRSTLDMSTPDWTKVSKVFQQKELSLNDVHESYGNGTLWTFTFDDLFPSSPTIGVDGTIYTYVVRDPRTNMEYSFGLYAIDAQGTFKWFSPSSSKNTTTQLVDYLLHSYIAIGQDGTIYCFENIEGMIEEEPGAYLGTSTFFSRVRAVEPTDGSLKWEYKIDKNLQITELRFSPNGMVLFSDQGSGFITALYPNGTLAWSTQISQMMGSFAIYPNGTILAIGLGNLYAIDSNGSILWNATSDCSGKIWLDEDGFVYCNEGHNLSKYYSNGTLSWRYAPQDVWNSITTVFNQSGNAYLAYSTKTYDESHGEMITHWLTSLSPDGHENWKGQHVIGSMALSNDDTLYVASGDHFAAVGSDGTTLWTMNAFQSPSPFSSGSSEGAKGVAVGPDGTAYLLGAIEGYRFYQYYIVATHGTPSGNDIGSYMKWMIPMAVMAMMTVILLVLFYAKKRGGENLN